MTRYVSAENRYDCPRCYIICAVREMKSDEGLMRCPNCDQLILFCPNKENPSVLMGAVDDVGLVYVDLESL